MLHYYEKIAGQSDLALRLPAIGGALLTAGLLFLLLRRFLDVEPAIFASCLTLEVLSPYALQVRPYTIMTSCFAAALLLWDQLNLRHSAIHYVGIGAVLATAIAFHFYSVLYVPCFGLLEIDRTRRTRQFRPALWGALLAAGATIFVWTPIMRESSTYTANDVATSSAYQMMPTWELLLGAYSYLIQGLGNLPHLGGVGINGVLVLAALALVAAASFAGMGKGAPSRWPDPDRPQRRAEFMEIVLCCLSVPLVIFVFTLCFTKTFNVRYVLAGSLGASALLAELFSDFPAFRRVLPLIVLAATGANAAWGVTSMAVFDHTSIYDALPGPSPIVVAVGSEFIALEEIAPPEFRARIVYLLAPMNVKRGDVTDENIIRRWERINPALPVRDLSTFVRENPKFYVLDERTGDDTAARYLERAGLAHPWKQIDGAVICRSF